MKPSDIFEHLAKPDNMALFLSCLEEGMWDEWDCDLGTAIANFGPTEFSVAARSAKYIALRIEDEDAEGKPTHVCPVCPHCGGTEDIFSKYRDGGSTLYHRGCPINPHATWPNPFFIFGKHRR